MINVQVSASLASVNVTADIQRSEDNKVTWTPVDALSTTVEYDNDFAVIANRVINDALEIVKQDHINWKGLQDIEQRLEGFILFAEA